MVGWTVFMGGLLGPRGTFFPIVCDAFPGGARIVSQQGCCKALKVRNCAMCGT